MESRKSTESGRKAAESWTGPRTLSPQHIIAFFGDTNDINHAQIRYVCEINHSPSGATRPRVSRFISVYIPIGHDLLTAAFIFFSLVSSGHNKHQQSNDLGFIWSILALTSLLPLWPSLLRVSVYYMWPLMEPLNW